MPPAGVVLVWSVGRRCLHVTIPSFSVCPCHRLTPSLPTARRGWTCLSVADWVEQVALFEGARGPASKTPGRPVDAGYCSCCLGASCSCCLPGSGRLLAPVPLLTLVAPPATQGRPGQAAAADCHGQLRLRHQCAPHNWASGCCSSVWPRAACLASQGWYCSQVICELTAPASGCSCYSCCRTS